MKNNQPVTDREIPYPERETLVSKTDLKGVITYCNRSFIAISGFTEAELVGSSHNIVRHPDMPARVFQQLWDTVKSGRPWTGVVKNRAKNGDYYWVKANVTPIRANGQITEFLSVRHQPTREQISEAEAFYAALNTGQARLEPGFGRRLGNWFKNLPLVAKLGSALAMILVLLSSAITLSNLSNMEGIVNEAKRAELEGYFQNLVTRMDAETFRAESMATVIALQPEVQQRLANGDREALLAQFGPSFDMLKTRYGVRQFQFHTPPATSFLRVHKPGKFGDDLTAIRKTIVATNAEKRPIHGLEEGVFGLGLRGLAPIAASDGTHIGSVEFGLSFDKTFFDRFKKAYGVDVALHVIKDQKFTTFGSTFGDQPLLSDKVLRDALAGQTGQQSAKLGGAPVTVYAKQVVDFSGKPIGVVEIAMDTSRYVTMMNDAQWQSWGLAVGGLLAALLAIMLLSRGIGHMISHILAAFEEIINGNFKSHIDIDRKDEMGRVLQGVKSLQIKMGFDVIDARDQADRALRVKTALDNASSGIMMADNDGVIIYMNDAVTSVMSDNADAIRQELPDFDAEHLVGANIDSFHKNPEHQRAMLARLEDTYRTQIEIGGRIFKLTAIPVRNEQGLRLGTAVEWLDATQQVQVEQQIERIIVEATSGNLDRRFDTRGAEGFSLAVGNGINALLDAIVTPIRTCKNMLQNVASGDLTERMEGQYQGEFEVLQAAVNDAIEKLSSIVHELHASSRNIANAASEIAQGNSDLSARTEKQAANLEETASSMEELTGTVEQNAANATQANELAANARSLAERGGIVVGNAVKAMTEISSSSTRIAEIIAVIDEIAFQTNLLALNASVEAARAGEQGRGFAVVAGEVRNLAQRSATAAKEIKELIQDSVGKVREGSALVDASGQTLEEIVQSVNKVSNIVSEIAFASQEQSQGIGQVGQAVNQMDQTTQQNAALVEQAAAAAESLDEQSRAMVDLIGFFRVSA